MIRSFTDTWHGVAYAEIGGLGIEGSLQLSGQGFAGLGCRFNETWSALGGSQHLYVDREFERPDVTTELSGPYLGVQLAF